MRNKDILLGPFAEGLEAFSQGQPKETNPYPILNDLHAHLCWDEGWDEHAPGVPVAEARRRRRLLASILTVNAHHSAMCFGRDDSTEEGIVEVLITFIAVCKGCDYDFDALLVLAREQRV